MTPVVRNRVIGLCLALLVFLVDQGVKIWVRESLRLQEIRVYDILPFFDLRWTENYGVSLGMLTATSVEMRWILVAMTSAIALFVFVWMLRERKSIDILALALVLGGALGNIRDRYLYGYVVDYADLHFGEFRPFLIFNIADAAITIGVLIILARSLLSREKPDPAREPDIVPES
jgi:signal peptidase II